MKFFDNLDLYDFFKYWFGYDLFQYLKRHIKWMFQRIFRGWDDRVIWSIDYYLIEKMPLWLEKLKKDKHGIPGLFTHNVSIERAEKEWNKVLDKIILGFVSAGKLVDLSEFNCWTELWNKWEKRYPNENTSEFIKIKNSDYYSSKNNPKWIELKKELNYEEKSKKEEKIFQKQYKDGMELFIKHFFDLWD